MSPESGSGGLVVCSPLRLEARAVRRGLGDRGEVRRSGYGAARAAAQADQLRHDTFGKLAVGGTGGGGGAGVARATTGASVSCPSAPLLAAELRRAGLRARAGTIVTVDRLIRNGQRERLGSGGALGAGVGGGGV